MVCPTVCCLGNLDKPTSPPPPPPSYSLTYQLPFFSDDIQASLNKHHPTIKPITPTSSLLPEVLVPSSMTQPLDLSPPPTSAKSTLPSEETQESLYDLFEYIDMLSLCSPRILKNHRVDPFISRYVVPDEIEHGHPDSDAHVSPVRVMTWTGLISARWILQLFCHIMYVNPGGPN